MSIGNKSMRLLRMGLIEFNSRYPRAVSKKALTSNAGAPGGPTGP